MFREADEQFLAATDHLADHVRTIVASTYRRDVAQALDASRRRAGRVLLGSGRSVRSLTALSNPPAAIRPSLREDIAIERILRNTYRTVGDAAVILLPDRETFQEAICRLYVLGQTLR